MDIEERIENVVWAAQLDDAAIASHMDPEVQLEYDGHGELCPASVTTYEKAWGKATKAAREQLRAGATEKLVRLAAEYPSEVEAIASALKRL